jgi:hypothetical protein
VIGDVRDNLLHLRNAFMYTVRLFLAYQLMLAIMTFNIGVSIAIFAGAFIGHFLFSRISGTVAQQDAEEENHLGCH